MRARTATLGLLAVLATGTAVAGAVVVVRAGEALPGTTVAGVDVGGLGRDDLRATLASAVTTRSTGTLQLVHEELRFPVDRRRLAADVDLDATVDAALAAGRENGPEMVLGPLLGRGEQVDLASSIDLAPVRARIDAVAAELDRPVFAGGIAVAGTTVTAQPPLVGRRLDRQAAAEDLAAALVSGRSEPLPLPVDTTDPGTTTAQVEQVAAQARAALTAPLRLVHPQVTLELAPAELGPLLRAERVGTGLALGVDRPALDALVKTTATRLSRPAVRPRFDVPMPPVVDTQGDLTWSPQPAQVRVTPGVPGLSVDAAAAAEALAGLVGTTTREAPLKVDVVPPAIGPGQEQAAGVTSLLGTFTTYFKPGQPRVRNIQTIARAVDGSYVPPGDLLSLNGVAGRRTRDKGYVEDSAIIDGELVPTVGGGVSQFATTLFNAAFFAGLPIEQYKAHSFYISRYPAGRESTVDFPSIDVRIRNDTARGMVVKAWTTGRSVTVGIYGDNGGRTVTSTAGPRRPRDGGGFTIEVTRTITGGDGRGGRRVFRTTYNPPPNG